MARFYLRTGKSTGLSLSGREAGEGLGALFGLVRSVFELAGTLVRPLLPALGVCLGAYLAKDALTDYVFNYAAHNQPHQASGFLYYLVVKGLLFLVTTPYTLASMMAGSAITPWPNLNLVAGVVLGVVLYRLLFALLASAKTVVAHPASLIAVMTPLAISLVYVLGKWLLGWLFSRS